jgi:hypothetical protein
MCLSIRLTIRGGGDFFWRELKCFYPSPQSPF